MHLPHGPDQATLSRSRGQYWACRLDEKIRKLDEQLAKHKEAIKKCRPGPAQEAAKRRALGVSLTAAPRDCPKGHMRAPVECCASQRMVVRIWVRGARGGVADPVGRVTLVRTCARTVLQVLKQKRMYESQREQLYNQQFNVDQTAFTMESAKDSIQTVQAMKVCDSTASFGCILDFISVL